MSCVTPFLLVLPSGEARTVQGTYTLHMASGVLEIRESAPTRHYMLSPAGWWSVEINNATEIAPANVAAADTQQIAH
jgi:hypothetical protein